MTKSKLNWRELYENCNLWWNVRHAEINHVHTYNTSKDVRNISIYKDKLIVVTSSSVKYLNVESFEEQKKYDFPNCYAFEENDDIILIVAKYGLSRRLTMHGKLSASEFNLCPDTETVLNEHLRLYKLVGNCCYTMDARSVLVEYEWKDFQWEMKLRARYYGRQNELHAIHVYKNAVYVVLKTGKILLNCMKSLNLTPVYSLDMPSNVKAPETFLCYPRCVVCKVNDESDWISKKHYMHYNFTLQCPGLSCVVEHGQALILAYETGKIQICIPKYMVTEDRISELDYQVELKRGERVQALAVYEGKGLHHLLVATNHSIRQLVITHRDLRTKFVPIEGT